MTSTPKNASSASSGTTTYGVRSRSSSRLETTYPTAPPPCWSGVASPRAGCGLPAAMCTMPSTPKASAAQPMSWRPAGPLRSGSRMLRSPMNSSISGTSQPTLPTEPATMVRIVSIGPPGSCHHTAAAAMTASADQQEADAVTPVLGVEVAGGAADAPGGGADGVGDPEPDRGGPAAEQGEEAEDRTRTVPHRARSRPAALGGSTGRRLAAGTPGSGARTCLRGPAGGSSRGRALAPRPRRGRRTGRHGSTLRESHQQHRSHRGVSAPRTRPREPLVGRAVEPPSLVEQRANARDPRWSSSERSERVETTHHAPRPTRSPHRRRAQVSTRLLRNLLDHRNPRWSSSERSERVETTTTARDHAPPHRQRAQSRHGCYATCSTTDGALRPR